MATLSADTQLITKRILELCNVLIDDFNSRGNVTVIDYEIQTGTKYYKIIQVDNPGLRYQSRSVHAFVDRQTGAVYKPASFRAPAKHVRYNLLDDASFQECLKRANYTGGYLYMK
jgi:hypothetical protein